MKISSVIKEAFINLISNELITRLQITTSTKELNAIDLALVTSIFYIGHALSYFSFTKSMTKRYYLKI